MHQNERRSARGSLVALGVGLSLVCCKITHADPLKHALVLPVQVAGYVPDQDVWLPAFDERLVKALLKGGYQTVKPTRKEAAACTDDDCLKSLAVKYHADVVLRAEVRGSTSGAPTYQIVVRLLDPSQSSPRRPFTQTCPACTEVNAAEMLYRMALQTLGPEPVPTAPPSTEPSPEPAPSLLPVPTPTAVTHDGMSPGARLAFRATGISLLVIGVGGFVGGGVETAREGLVDATQQRRTVDGQALFYTIGAVGVVGGVVLTTLGWLPQPKGVAIVPQVSSSTASLSVVGKF